MKSTITLTFGDVAENHVSMQKIGTLASYGFTLNDLTAAQNNFDQLGVKTTLYPLHQLATCVVDEAYLLVVHNALGKDYADIMLDEQNKLTPDSKAKAYGKVINKKARHNLCFDDVSQPADYEQGMGTVVSFSDVPALANVREWLPSTFGAGADKLKVEGNYYYDVTKCYIGWHGDAERKKVIGLRLGESFPLHYQWYNQSQAQGQRFSVMLDHGDIYMMSEKAVGSDWKKRSHWTLRHAAGFTI